MPDLNEPQTLPVYNPTLPSVWDLVIDDMRERDLLGRAKYGTPLQPHNGRQSLIDAYQEALDQVVYLRTEIEERKRLSVEAEIVVKADAFDSIEPDLILLSQIAAQHGHTSDAKMSFVAWACWYIETHDEGVHG
jgi:hypothetical protein